MTQPVYDLTEQQWQQHTAHRRQCADNLCDHPAHHYAKAFADRRVHVAGTPVDAHGAPIPPV